MVSFPFFFSRGLSSSCVCPNGMFFSGAAAVVRQQERGDVSRAPTVLTPSPLPPRLPLPTTTPVDPPPHGDTPLRSTRALRPFGGSLLRALARPHDARARRRRHWRSGGGEHHEEQEDDLRLPRRRRGRRGALAAVPGDAAAAAAPAVHLRQDQVRPEARRQPRRPGGGRGERGRVVGGLPIRCAARARYISILSTSSRQT